MALIPNSALSRTIRELPEDFVIRPEGLRNMLGRTVKPEELDYSGIDEFLSDFANSDMRRKITKQDLVDFEKHRADSWGSIERSGGNAPYVATRATGSDADYALDVRTYMPDSKAPRVVVSHFNDLANESYLAHSRYTVENLQGRKTRVIQEIQSDLHQKARKLGYQGETRTSFVIDIADENRLDFDAGVMPSAGQRSIIDELRNKEFKSQEEAEKFIDRLSAIFNENPVESGAISIRKEEMTNLSGVPDAPLKKNWMRKELERQVLKAFEAGEDSVGVIIDGDVSGLSRAAGAQKWYETTVLSTVQKLAKQIPGAKFEMVVDTNRHTGLPTNVATIVLPTEGRTIKYLAPDRPETVDELSRLISNEKYNTRLLEAFVRKYTTRGINNAGADGQTILKEVQDNWEKLADDMSQPKVEFKIPRDSESLLHHADVERQDEMLALMSDITDDMPWEFEQYNMDIERVTNKHFIDWIESMDSKQIAQAIKDHPIIEELLGRTAGASDREVIWPMVKEEIREIIPNFTTEFTDVKQFEKFWNKAPKEIKGYIVNNMEKDHAKNLLTSELREYLTNPNLTDTEAMDYLRASFTRMAANALRDNSASLSAPRILNAKDYDLLVNFPGNVGTDSNLGIEMNRYMDEDFLNILMDIYDETMQNSDIGIDNIGIMDYINSNWKYFDAMDIVNYQTEKVTPGVPKYPTWVQNLELYSAAGLGLYATLNPDDASAQQDLMAEYDPISTLLNEGYTSTDIKGYLKDEEGMGDEEADEAIRRSLKAQRTRLEEMGYSKEEINAFMEDEYGESPAEPQELKEEPKEQAELTQRQELANNFEYVPVAAENQYDEKTTTELAKAAENVLENRLAILDFAGGWLLEDPAKLEEADNAFKEVNYAIANSLRSLGRNVVVGEENMAEGIVPGVLYEVQDDGTHTPLTEDIWEDIGWALVKSEKEIGGALAGAALGTAAVSRWLAAQPTTPGKLISIPMYFAADILGGLAGGVIGRSLDMVENSYAVKEDLELKFYSKQLAEAGLFELIIAPAASLTLRGVVGLTKTVGRAGKMVLSGNSDGAQRALREYTNLSEEQIAEVIQRYERIAGERKGSTNSKALEVIPQTQPDMEALVKEAAQYDPALTMRIGRAIDKRAKDVIANVNKATPDDVGIVIKKELDGYVKAVKNNFQNVKTAGSREIPASYKYNIDTLAIKKYAREIKKKVSNSATRRRVKNYLRAIKQLEIEPSFANLIELRKTLNDFKYNTKIRQFHDQKAINSMIANIDREIVKTANTYMKDGDGWIKSWKMANMEYSKMKSVKKNVLWRALMKEPKDGGLQGQNTKTIIRQLANHISDIDGTFMQVVEKLPVEKQKLVENAVLDFIVEKHTLGSKEGLQAIDFPALADELESMAFSSIKARNNKRIIRMLSDVFKNDANLHGLAHHSLGTNKNANVMTPDLTAKAHWSLMNVIWNKLQAVVPFSKNADYVALGFKIEKALRNPRDAKAVEDLIKEFPRDDTIASHIRQLALVPSKFGEPANYPYIQIGKRGGVRAVKDGQYGRFVYWTTDTDSLKSATGPTRITKKDMLPKALATEADIKKILGVEQLTPAIIKENAEELEEQLAQRGYYGFAIGHDIMMFAE